MAMSAELREAIAMEIDEATESQSSSSTDPMNPDNIEMDHISDDEEGGVRIGDIYIPPAPKPALSFDPTGPRLVIYKIVNENFKSYGGVQTLGPFHKCFTAIIGPNGSGKSNVIDSMLFVFGSRASKIRSKKISVLLHNSNKYPDVTSATVAVHFCQIVDGVGDEDFEVVPHSHFVITRTAYKDNTSFYTVNGRKVQFKEVARILRSHGIDLNNNRFLILQGEVEQIAMMKPKALSEHDTGMLEYLEDIIGTSRYKEPIDKLSSKVDEYTEMRKDKLNRVRLVEQEKMKLEKPMKEAVFLVNTLNSATRNRNLLTQKYIYETEKIIESKNRDILMFKEKINSINSKLSSISKELEKKQDIISAGSEKYTKLKKEKDAVGDKLHLCKRKIATAQANITQSNKKKKNLEQLLEQEKGKLIDLELIPEKNKREIEDCEKLVEKHKATKRKAEEESQAALLNIRTKTRGLQEQKDKLQDKLMDLKRIVDETNSHFRMAESRLKIYVSNEKNETEKLEKIKADYEKAKTNFEICQAKQKETKEIIATDENGIKKMQMKIDSLKMEEDSLYAEVCSLREIIAERDFEELRLMYEQTSQEELWADFQMPPVEIIDELKVEESSTSPTEPKSQEEMCGDVEMLPVEKIEELKVDESSTSSTEHMSKEDICGDIKMPLVAIVEECKQAMSAYKSRGKVLDSLMDEKRRGAIPGIYGRLGDLGAISPKYDVAVSTCCSALDHIVVDTVKTAQACLEHLRKYSVGRATFIALEKQEHLKKLYEKKPTYPENVSRIFELIKVNDERVLPAFYFALRDTLVAKDLEQATRIAYGPIRYRVVSLQGDVIEKSGTMSGGGRSAVRGRMSSSVIQDTSGQHDYAATEKKLKQLDQKLYDNRKEQSELRYEIISLQNSIFNEKTTLTKLDVEMKSLNTQIPSLKIQIRDQEKRAASYKVDEIEKKRLEEEVETFKEKWEKANFNAGEVEKEVRAVDAQITAAAGGKIKELEKIVNDMNTKITKVSTEITKLRVAITTSARNAKKSKDKISQMETDLEETRKLLEELNVQKKQSTLEIGELQKRLEEIDEELNEGTNEFSEIKSEITALNAKEMKIKSERLEVNNTLYKTQRSLEELREKMRKWFHDLTLLNLEEPGCKVPGLEDFVPLVKHTPEELDAHTVEDLRTKIKVLLEQAGDNKPNLQAIIDYKATETLYLKRARELDEITGKRNEMRALYDELRKKRQNDFLCGFNIITQKLKEMYQMITLGGDAELELVDSLDPFTEGITFSVRPPNKSWKNISNLSGGEKTLSSLALVFALHYYRPTPLYVMDEIDAALDFKNVSIVANYIKERTKNAQFIIISLRYNMFEVANRLTGIYKTDDCTQSVTVENRVPSEFFGFRNSFLG